MGLISPQQAADNSTAVNAASVNNPINTIANEFNGNIDNSNIKAGAAIATSKLAQDNGNLAIKPVIAYKFSVYRTAALNAAGASATTLVPFDTKAFDTGSNVDIVTNVGRFTAPVAGFYLIGAHVGMNGAVNGVYNVQIFKNGATIWNLAQLSTASNSNIGGSTILQLAANDFLDIRVFNAATTAAVFTGAGTTDFWGELVSV